MPRACRMPARRLEQETVSFRVNVPRRLRDCQVSSMSSIPERNRFRRRTRNSTALAGRSIIQRQTKSLRTKASSLGSRYTRQGHLLLEVTTARFGILAVPRAGSLVVATGLLVATIERALLISSRSWRSAARGLARRPTRIGSIGDPFFARARSRSVLLA